MMNLSQWMYTFIIVQSMYNVIWEYYITVMCSTVKRILRIGKDIFFPV